MPGMQNVRFSSADGEATEELTEAVGPTARHGLLARFRRASGYHNDEAAARHHLTEVFRRDERPAIRTVAALDRPESVPDMRVVRTDDSPLTSTRTVTFEQVSSTIPIFGSRATVELNKDRSLVSVDADIADVGEILPAPTMSQADALGKIAAFAGEASGATPNVDPATLTYYHDDEKDVWHLAFVFSNVPLTPPGFLDAPTSHHGLGRSPRSVRPTFNYLVDAHDGGILFYYSAGPTLDVPTKAKGIDEDNIAQDFFCRKASPSGYALDDPSREIKTYDFGFNDLDSTHVPATPIYNAGADFGNQHKAGVSAHVSAMRVYDFYSAVLKRAGIDDKKMTLISMVNCVYEKDEPAPEWHNAMWWDNRMWYGQVKNGAEFQSFSRYLDIIAHELTHGVTEYTAALVYKDQSGALNESFSDIFGIIIKNWYGKGADSDAGGWDWELGTGLGDNGLPLRDMSDPTRTGDPDHMNQYLRTNGDSGGVHTNSNIHNKAAFNILTAKDAQGGSVIPTREVAILYYLCLTRIGQLATFPKTLQALVDVANTLYAGNDVERTTKVNAIRDAYQKVGIALP